MPLHVYCPTWYEGAMRRLMTRYKFHGETGWHKALAALLVRMLAVHHAGGLRMDAVAAVPLHRERMRERGYNQSGLLAAVVARQFGVPDLSRGLLRTGYTRRQTETSGRDGRFANVSGAFSVPDPLAFRGRSLLLIDDVLTSGATLLACRDAIARFRPASITGAVVSSSVPPDGSA